MKKLLGPRVLVRKREAGEAKKGEIILPEAVKKRESENKTEFTVVKVGQGMLLRNGSYRQTPAKPDDVIIVSGHAIPVDVEGETLFVFNQDDIICIL